MAICSLLVLQIEESDIRDVWVSCPRSWFLLFFTPFYGAIFHIIYHISTDEMMGLFDISEVYELTSFWTDLAEYVKSVVVVFSMVGGVVRLSFH